MRTKKNTILLLLFVTCYTSSCYVTAPAYYLNPMDNNAHYYHPVPMQKDSLRSALYASAVYTDGGSNRHWNDKVTAFQGSIHQSRNIGHFQAYYGGMFTIGKYDAKEYGRYEYSGGYIYPLYIDTILIIPAKEYSFGAYGINGGSNFIIPLRGRHEWRLGVQTSVQKEFGDYFGFRKSLIDQPIDQLATSKWSVTTGINTEFVWKPKKNIEFGERILYGLSWVTPKDYVSEEKSGGSPFYFTNTVHLTVSNTTGFIQVNFSSHAFSAQFGGCYKLAGRKMK